MSPLKKTVGCLCLLGLCGYGIASRREVQPDPNLSANQDAAKDQRQREAAILDGLRNEQQVVLVSLNDRKFWQMHWRLREADLGSCHSVVTLGNDASHWGTHHLKDDRQSKRCKIITVGSSMVLARALANDQIDGAVDTNGYGTGYRAVQLLAQTPHVDVPIDSEAELQVAERVFESSDPAQYFLFLRQNMGQNTGQTGESYIPNRFVSSNLNRIQVAVPLNSDWWRQFAQGCRTAANDCGVTLAFDSPSIAPTYMTEAAEMPPLATRIVRLTWDADNQSGLINRDIAKNNTGLVLKSSSVRITQSIRNAMMGSKSSASGDLQRFGKVWLLHSQNDRSVAENLSRDLTKLLPSSESIK